MAAPRDTRSPGLDPAAGSPAAEASPESAEELGRILDEAGPVGIFRTDATGACTYVNQKWSAMAGLSRADALAEGWMRALHPQDRQAVLNSWREAVRERRPFHGRFRLQGPGGVCWVMAQARELLSEEGELTGYVGAMTEVASPSGTHEMTQWEGRLADNVIDSSVDGILAFDRACRYTLWNPAMEKLSGVSASRTLGQVAFEVFPFLRDIGEDFFFYEALAGRNAVARDRRYLVPATGHAGFFEGRYTPLRDARGEVIGGLAIIRDVTELKEAQAQLIQAGKLAAMGQLGAGIAHELNQPLTGIRLMLDLVANKADTPVRECREDIEMMVKEITRMGRIVDNVRAFAREGSFHPQPVAALQPVEDALALMAEQLRLAEIDVVRSYAPALPAIFADAVRLQQVFLNLLSNALHALERHAGSRRLEVGARERDARVEFWVEDTGPGVPPDSRDKVFEPFFTTRDPGVGTGLGLSLCHGIVREHAGEIRVETAQSGGARFVLDIPRSHSERPAEAVEVTPAERRSRPRRVLVVDDEPVLRQAVSRSLEFLGYECEAVGDASAALARADSGHFDAALVDLKMPTVGGASLCAELRARRPHLALVVMTGFAAEEEQEELLRGGVRAILPKPFGPASLEEVLNRVLED